MVGIWKFKERQEPVLTGFVESSEQISSGWITQHLIIKRFWVGVGGWWGEERIQKERRQRERSVRQIILLKPSNHSQHGSALANQHHLWSCCYQHHNMSCASFKPKEPFKKFGPTDMHAFQRAREIQVRYV